MFLFTSLISSFKGLLILEVSSFSGIVLLLRFSFFSFSLFTFSTIFTNPSSTSLLASFSLTSITTPSGNLTPFTMPDFIISTLTQFSTSLFFSVALLSIGKFCSTSFSSIFSLLTAFLIELIFLLRLNSL